MQSPQFQAQRPQVQQPKVQRMSGGGGKNLLGALTSLGMGIATGNPMQMASGGLGLLGAGGAADAVAGISGGGEAGIDGQKPKKSKTDSTSTDTAQTPPEQGMQSVFQPMGQMLDPMSLFMAMSQQQAPNMMNSMQMNPAFGPQQPQQQQMPPQQWGTPNQFWSGGW